MTELGKRFIEQELAGLVSLNEGEALVPWETRFQRDIVMNADGDELANEIVANHVIFSRAIDGIDVIGEGSKVEVVFANDGEPVAFSYDWPSLKPEVETQRLIRGDALVVRSAAYAVSTKPADHIGIDHFECGYWDPGYDNRDRAGTLQAGGLFQTVRSRMTPNGNGGFEPMRWGIADVIPAGDQVRTDSEWPQAKARRRFGCCWVGCDRVHDTRYARRSIANPLQFC